MDIIEWNEDPVVFIQNALSPAQVLKVDFNEEAHACIVVVPDNQLSLAIGKRGQNARLAARLTTYKIDIKSESSYADYLEEQAALALEAQAAAEASQEDLAEKLPAETLDQAVEVEDLKLESEPAGEE